MNNITECEISELVEELSKREGVEVITAEPYEDKTISVKILILRKMMMNLVLYNSGLICA